MTKLHRKPMTVYTSPLTMHFPDNCDHYIQMPFAILPMTQSACIRHPKHATCVPIVPHRRATLGSLTAGDRSSRHPDTQSSDCCCQLDRRSHLPPNDLAVDLLVPILVMSPHFETRHSSPSRLQHPASLQCCSCQGDQITRQLRWRPHGTTNEHLQQQQAEYRMVSCEIPCNLRVNCLDGLQQSCTALPQGRGPSHHRSTEHCAKQCIRASYCKPVVTWIRAVCGLYEAPSAWAFTLITARHGLDRATHPWSTGPPTNTLQLPHKSTNLLWKSPSFRASCTLR